MISLIDGAQRTTGKVIDSTQAHAGLLDGRLKSAASPGYLLSLWAQFRGVAQRRDILRAGLSEEGVKTAVSQ